MQSNVISADGVYYMCISCRSHGVCTLAFRSFRRFFDAADIRSSSSSNNENSNSSNNNSNNSSSNSSSSSNSQR